MISIDSLRIELEEKLANLNWSKAPQGLYTPVEYSMALGGKRIRPVMCLASCLLFTDNYQKAIPAALAIEIFHNFTLLHDDVMDKADIRRGNPTVWKKWNANTAILSGDAMLIEAYKLLAQTDSPAFSMILNTFNQTALEVCEGQQYDMEFETRDDVTIEEYMEMIKLKTAVLLAGAIKIGALIGGASDIDTEALYNFAIKLGLAFQLQDDLLDTYGDEKTFGKAIGGDIMENKKTYLLISALQNAKPEQLNTLQAWMEAENPKREEKVEAIRNIYDEIGVKNMTEDKINELFKQATQIVREMNISAEGKLFFTEFANKLLKRNK
jgi:geranylgeranyl diphosphate synthase type II